MMNEKMAAYHESAHAVADYLMGIELSCMCIVRRDYGTKDRKEWGGLCRPVEAKTHKKLQIVSDLAGLFGAQLSEGIQDLRIPANTNEFATYGAYGAPDSDWNIAGDKCGVLIIKARFPDWINEEPKDDPELKAKYDQQIQRGEALRDELFNVMLDFTRGLISENREHVISLGDYLLDQPLEELEGPDNCEDTEPGTKRFVRRLSGEQIWSHLKARGLESGESKQAVEAVPYPE